MATNSSEDRTIKLMVTAGGSGGHLNTAFGLFDKLRGESPDIFSEIVFLGGKKGMIGESTASIEARKVPEQGVRFIGIRSGKLHRQFNLQTIKLLFGVIGGVWDAFRVVKAEKPDLVFSTGGYVTVPVVFAAWVQRIPVVIHEQTTSPGLANRIAGKFAKKVLLTFPDKTNVFPLDKAVITGNVIRASRLEPSLPGRLPDSENAYAVEYLDFLKRSAAGPLLFITGGGLGSHKINTWVAENLEKLADLGYVLIQTGENTVFNDYDSLQEVWKGLPEQKKAKVYIIKWFGDEIGYIYHHVELVLGRPGANTILELLATDNKAVLVPIPWSSGGEQRLNAEYFCSIQTGEIVEQEKIYEELLPAVQRLINIESKVSAPEVNLDAVDRIWAELRAQVS